MLKYFYNNDVTLACEDVSFKAHKVILSIVLPSLWTNQSFSIEKVISDKCFQFKKCVKTTLHENRHNSGTVGVSGPGFFV